MTVVAQRKDGVFGRIHEADRPSVDQRDPVFHGPELEVSAWTEILHRARHADVAELHPAKLVRHGIDPERPVDVHAAPPVIIRDKVESDLVRAL